MKPILMVLMFVSASLAGCLSSDDSSSSQVEAIFDYDPSSNIRTDMEIEFDAGASLPSDGGLTYKWDFDNDGSYDETGRTTTWTYSNAGDYDVTLTVSDGTDSSSQTRTLKVIDADAVEPEANAGSDSPVVDCHGEGVTSGDYYLIYICEMDKSTSSKSVMATAEVALDGSDSDPGSSDEYISEYKWDLNLQKDEDDDGDPENDADLTGETVDWKEVAPGEYEIALTVTNGAGLSHTDGVTVNVNYVGKWNEFSIGGNTSNNAIDIDFSFHAVYDEDSGNTIKRAEGLLVYPKEDSDCTDVVPGEGSNCRAKLDLHGFNSTDEEAGNTSSYPVDQRNYGDCDSDTDCVQQTFSWEFSETQFKDGEWTMTIRNEMVNDLEIESLTISLLYK